MFQKLTQCTLPLGKHGSVKSFEELRRAIVSAQPPEGPEPLRLGGSLARWFAQGAQGPAPTHWHLLLLVGGSSRGNVHDDGQAAMTRAAHRVCKKLIKKGFLSVTAHGDVLRLTTAEAPLRVTLQLCTAEAPHLPNVPACEQLTFDVATKSWHPLGGLELEKAWQYMLAGYWRAPGVATSPEHMPEESGDAVGIDGATQALVHSWRQQQAGFSPTDALVKADVSALVEILVEVDAWHREDAAAAAKRTVALVHAMLAPALSAENSPDRHRQLGLAAVALCQLTLALPAFTQTAAGHPLVEAVRAFLRSQGSDPHPEIVASLALTEALAADVADTALLRQCLGVLPAFDPMLACQTVPGLHAPMLRVHLPALHSHLYVPATTTHEAMAWPSLPPLTVALPALLGSAQPVGNKMAQLLGCPSLQHVMTPQRLGTKPLRELWADLLLARLHDEPNSAEGGLDRVVLAIGLLSPRALAAVPEELQRAALPPCALADTLAALARECPDGASRAHQLVCAQRLAAWVPLHLPAAWPRADAPLKKLLQALLALELNDLALQTTQNHADVLPLLANQDLLQLFKAAVKRNHSTAREVLEHAASRPATAAYLIAETNGIIAACKHGTLLETIALVLAGPLPCPTAVWQAWLKAACARSTTAPLVAFVAGTADLNPQLALAARALTDKVMRKPEVKGLNAAVDAWRRRLSAAMAVSESGLEEAVALLQLSLLAQQADLGTVMGEDLLAILARLVLRHGQSELLLGLAYQISNKLPDMGLRAEVLGHMFEHLTTSQLKAVWQQEWHLRLREAMLYAHGTNSRMKEQTALKFFALAVQAFGSPAEGAPPPIPVPLVDAFDDVNALKPVEPRDALLGAILCGQLLAQSRFVALSHAVFDHALNCGATQSGMMELLEEQRLLDADNDAWLSVVEAAARQIAWSGDLELQGGVPMPLNKVVFWSRMVECMVQSRCEPSLLEAMDANARFEALRGAMQLLQTRDAFTSLSRQEIVLQNFAIAAGDPAINGRLIEHLRQMLLERRALPPMHEVEADDGPLAVLCAALLRGAQLFDKEPMHARARALLHEIFGVEFDGGTHALAASTQPGLYNVVIEFADLLLAHPLGDAERQVVLESLVTCCMNAPAYIENLGLLCDYTAGFGLASTSKPLAMAARHISGLFAEQSPTPEQRICRDRAALNTAYAMRLLSHQGNSVERIACLELMLCNVSSVENETAHQWFNLIDTLRLPSERMIFEDGGAAALKELVEHKHRMLPLTQFDIWHPKVMMINEISALTPALHDSDVATRQTAFNSLLHLAVDFDAFENYHCFNLMKKELALLNGQPRFHFFTLQMLTLNVIVNPDSKLPASFVRWLLEVFTQGAPLSAAACGVLRALVEAKPKQLQDAPQWRALDRQLHLAYPQHMHETAEALRADIVLAQQQVHENSKEVVTVCTRVCTNLQEAQ